MAGLLMGMLKRRKSAEESSSSRIGRRCGSMRKEAAEEEEYWRAALSPLIEGPTAEIWEGGGGGAGRRRYGDVYKKNEKQGRLNSKNNWWLMLMMMKGSGSLQNWKKNSKVSKSNSMSRITDQPPAAPPHLCLLFSVFAAPLAPIPVDSRLISNYDYHIAIPHPKETSSAQYIIQQYVCATGAAKLSETTNMYAMGRVKMEVLEFEAAAGGGGGGAARNAFRSGGSGSSAPPINGCFVLWQMNNPINSASPKDMWILEIALQGGIKAGAGSDGELVWRHTPWLGSHVTKGPVRPLRRSLQGLDPRAIAGLFTTARCIGEKAVRGEDCFILKVVADRRTLQSRSDEDVEEGRLGGAEILRHTIHGYFSQKTGLLVQIEDSHLTKVELSGGAVFWETAIESHIEEYRSVDGVEICHGGRSIATLHRFGGGGDEAGDGGFGWTSTATKLLEEWKVEEVAFDVPGLSQDLFITPAEIRKSGGDSEIGRRFENRAEIRKLGADSAKYSALIGGAHRRERRDGAANTS